MTFWCVNHTGMFYCGVELFFRRQQHSHFTFCGSRDTDKLDN